MKTPDKTSPKTSTNTFAKTTGLSDNSISSTSFDWTDEAYEKFGKESQILSHNYHQSPLFSDTALINLLDNYPRQWLQCYTMGIDPLKHKEWTPVHIDKLTGEEIITAVKKGRMWINVIRINEYQQDYVDLIDSMYVKINNNCNNITNAKGSFSALLISSPGIQVYYHLDADPNMLWHLKGSKKVWVYPNKDERFASQQYIEEIIGQERHENVPYELWFDEHAQAVELQAGQVLSWPQHSPHRIENVDLNVSLATSYQSRESTRLNSVHAANHYFLKPMGISNRSTETQGIIPAVKEISYRGMNKLKLLKAQSRSASYVSNIVADPNSESGMSKKDDETRTAFSYVD